MESIWHSSFCAEPSGVPSSKNARLYHSPSQACDSREAFSEAARLRQLAARSTSPRRSAMRANSGQVHVEEPAQPDALAAALATDAIHAVVPIAASDQRQAVAAHGEAPVEGSRAMLVAATPGLRTRSARSTTPLVLGEARPVEPGDGFVEHRLVAAGPQVVEHGVGQPEAVVGDPRTHARGRTADATSAGRRPRGTAEPRRAGGARAPGPAASLRGPGRPGAGRGTRRRRRTGRTRSAPRCGTRGFDRGASG